MAAIRSYGDTGAAALDGPRRGMPGAARSVSVPADSTERPGGETLDGQQTSEVGENRARIRMEGVTARRRGDQRGAVAHGERGSAEMEAAAGAQERQRWPTEERDAVRRRSRRRLALPHWLLAVADDKWSATGAAVRLLNDTEVEPMRREPYITGGYLPSGSFALCLRALLLPTNELFNSWTALLPALGYLWRLHVSTPPPDCGDPRPYHCLLLSVALSCLASFLAHGFSAVSPVAGQLFYGLDYAGITLLGLAMTMAEHAYGGDGDDGGAGWLDGVLLPAAGLLALLGCAAACWSRLSRCQHRGQRLRLRGQAGLFLWSAAAGRWTAGRVTAALCAAAAVAVYAARWPERRWPGRFDVLGHSHGTFHVLTQLAAGCCVATVHARMAASTAPLPADLHWWLDVGYTLVATGLVATAVGFAGLYAAAESHTKELPSPPPSPLPPSPQLPSPPPPQAGDPEVRPDDAAQPATPTHPQTDELHHSETTEVF